MEKMKRRLKNKIWKVADIKIKRIVEQTKEGSATENKTVGWTVVIDKPTVRVSFSKDNERELWKAIKDEVILI